jgi:RNA polymerase sigma factor (sigma-70 family)
VVFFGVVIFFGVLMVAQAGPAAGSTVMELIRKYQRKTENDVAFALIDRYKSSNRQQQGEIIWGLLAPHQQDLSRIVAGMNEDPQEEMQKLFLKIHELFVREKYPHSNWKYWLSRIVKNEIINQKKRQKNFSGLPTDLIEEVDNTEERERKLTQLKQAIERLSENQKKAILLRYGPNKEDKLMTYKEMASVMQCSPGQVHGYLDRAKENLRNYLNELVES